MSASTMAASPLSLNAPHISAVEPERSRAFGSAPLATISRTSSKS